MKTAHIIALLVVFCALIIAFGLATSYTSGKFDAEHIVWAVFTPIIGTFSGFIIGRFRK